MLRIFVKFKPVFPRGYVFTLITGEFDFIMYCFYMNI